MQEEELNLYHIPAKDTSFTQDVSNPADITISNGGIVPGSVVNTGLNEQQVREIVGQNISTGLKEEQVRAIINSALAPTLGSLVTEDVVRAIVAGFIRGANLPTEARIREIVNSMQKFLTGQNIMVDGIQKSQNFYTGISGWQIDAEGNAEFNNGTFRGTFILGGTLVTVNDITLLQENIDLVSSLGGGTISLVPDTYTATSSFTIPSNVTLDGNGATIDFGNGAYQILIQGTNAYSTGTLSATYGSTAIVGVGTTWTSGMVGRNILIGDYWYEITAFTDTTHITIGTSFLGTNLSGDTYVIATTVDNVGLQNITLYNSSTTFLKFRYVNGFSIDGVVCDTAPQGMDGDDSANVQWVNSTLSNLTVGLTWDNVPFCVINNSNAIYITGGTAWAFTRVTNTAMGVFSIQAVTGVGIKFTNCSNLGFLNYAIIECSSHGVEFVSGNSDIDSVAGYISTCGGDGIKLTATSDRCTVVATSIINNIGYGINIAASTDDNNQIIAPAFSNNTAGNINDSGTGTFISPQTLSTFIVQDVPLATGTGEPNDNFQVMTSNATGTVLYIGEDYGGTTATIFRLVKDTTTSNYRVTHTTTLTVSTAGLNGMAATSGFLYVMCTIAGVSSLRRYSLADLSGVTTMTISGTNDLSNGPAWSDGTDLYTYQSSGTFRKYTISGTTATNGGTVAFTTSGVAQGCICDGTNVWITDATAAGTVNIRKYPVAGGAATSTTSFISFWTAYLNVGNATGLGLFIASSTILGIGFKYNTTSATAVVGELIHLSAIALP